MYILTTAHQSAHTICPSKRTGAQFTGKHHKTAKAIHEAQEARFGKTRK